MNVLKEILIIVLNANLVIFSMQKKEYVKFVMLLANLVLKKEKISAYPAL